MSNLAIFLTGVGLSTGVSLLVVAYLRSPLKLLLAELCGTPERARFWAAFSDVTVLLVPLIFAMQYEVEPRHGMSLFFELSAQLKWALVGLVITLVALAIVLSNFIPRRPPTQDRLSG